MIAAQDTARLRFANAALATRDAERDTPRQLRDRQTAFVDLAQAALVAGGVGAAVARNADVLGIITIAGAAYLLSLGVAVIRHPAPIATREQPSLSPLSSGLRGAAVSGLNPKGLLLFFAILPQFAVMNAAWPVPVQLAVLGMFHVAACSIVYLAVAFGARRLLHARPRAARIAGRSSGAAMIVVGLAGRDDRGRPRAHAGARHRHIMATPVEVARGHGDGCIGKEPRLGASAP